MRRYQVLLLVITLSLFSFSVSISCLGEIKKVVALTFDDGPHPKITEKILSILKKENVKATFFIVGKMGKRYSYLLKAINKAGCEIENHTYSHPDLTKLSIQKIEEEFLKTYNLIKKITEQDSYFFRPPGGHYNDEIINIAHKLNYRMVLWTNNTGDYKISSPNRIYLNAINKIQNKGIILLHNGRQATIDALVLIIKDLKEKGYEFLTISQLYELINHEELRKINIHGKNE